MRNTFFGSFQFDSLGWETIGANETYSIQSSLTRTRTAGLMDTLFCVFAQSVKSAASASFFSKIGFRLIFTSGCTLPTPQIKPKTRMLLTTASFRKYENASTTSKVYVGRAGSTFTLVSVSMSVSMNTIIDPGETCACRRSGGKYEYTMRKRKAGGLRGREKERTASRPFYRLLRAGEITPGL